MNKEDKLDILIKDILKEEIDDIPISNKEIELEWRKFQKLQKEKNEKKYKDCKILICFIAAIACMCLVFGEVSALHKDFSQNTIDPKYNYKESNVIYL